MGFKANPTAKVRMKKLKAACIGVIISQRSLVRKRRCLIGTPGQFVCMCVWALHNVKYIILYKIKIYFTGKYTTLPSLVKCPAINKSKLHGAKEDLVPSTVPYVLLTSELCISPTVTPDPIHHLYSISRIKCLETSNLCCIDWAEH